MTDQEFEEQKAALLQENMYALETPKFVGTNEEMINAINYWVSMVSQLRGLFGVVTNYDNKSAIVDRLGQEVAIMTAELNNLSARPVPNDTSGGIKLVAPLPQNQPAPDVSNPTAVAQQNAVDLSVREQIERMQKAAGIVKTDDKLRTALKRYMKDGDVPS